MAWWTDIIFFRRRFEEIKTQENGSNLFVRLFCVFRRTFYDNFIDTLHNVLVVATYAYFGANITIFFFQGSLSRNFISIVETFSEPYLGALGIYIVVNEIRRRRGKNVHPHFSTAFATSWMILLLVSTVLVYLGDTYHFNTVYRTIVTNSFAAFIIRLGFILGRTPP